MLPSQLNRVITIEKEQTSTNSVGTPTEEYAFWKQTHANVRFLSGSSEYAAEGTLPFTRAEFTIRYDPNINYKCRILYDNQYYEIGHIQTIGRNHWLKIVSVVWEGELQNGSG